MTSLPPETAAAPTPTTTETPAPALATSAECAQATAMDAAATYSIPELIKKSKLKPEQLSRLAEKNKAVWGDKADTAWIQRGVGLVGSDVDGLWGTSTVAALIEWQRRKRFTPDGLLTVEQSEHFPVSGDAIPDPIDTDTRPIPKFCRTKASSTNKPYDHAYWPDDPTSGGWPVIDNQWEAITGTGSWLGAMLRLLTGRGMDSKGQVYYDREPDDFITLDTYSLGFAHFWADTAPQKVLAEIVRRLPKESVNAWGKPACDILLDPKKVKAITGVERGPRRYNPRTLSWLVAGWSRVARLPEALAVQVEVWLKDYVGEALAICAENNLPLNGREGGLVLAAVSRMCNSSPVLARTAIKKFWRKGSDASAAVGMLRDIYALDREQGGYSKRGNGPRRWDVLERTCRVEVSKAIKERMWAVAAKADLNLNAPIERSRGLR